MDIIIILFNYYLISIEYRSYLYETNYIFAHNASLLIQ